MRYFIADLEAEGAVAQVGESRAEELPAGRLRYRVAGSSEWREAEAGQWSSKWNRAARVALERLKKAMEESPDERERLERIKAELLSASDELRRDEQQLGLFGAGRRS